MLGESICYFSDVESILSLNLFLMENRVTKHCRPLGLQCLPNNPFTGFQVRMGWTNGLSAMRVRRKILYSTECLNDC